MSDPKGKPARLGVVARAGRFVSKAPYSTGIVCGDVIYMSGMVPIDQDTGAVIVGDAEMQTHRLLDALEANLRPLGLGLDHVVRGTIYLASMAEWDPMNAAWRARFAEPFPARSCVVVAGLPLPQARLEVDFIVSTRARRSG